MIRQLSEHKLEYYDDDQINTALASVDDNIGEVTVICDNGEHVVKFLGGDPQLIIEMRAGLNTSITFVPRSMGTKEVWGELKMRLSTPLVEQLQKVVPPNLWIPK